MSPVQNVLSGRCYYHNAGKINSGHRIVGMIMKNETNSYGLLTAGLFFLGVPLSLYFTGDTAGRTIIKDAISILTVLAFILTLGQFYLARTVTLPIRSVVMVKVILLHKCAGYVGAALLLIHPFLIVVPRYLEAGVSPERAFITMVTTNTPGVIAGIAAWVLLLLISIMSALRSILPLRYRTWRQLHGLMSVSFMVTASWHALYLGRHINQPLSAYIVVLATVGIFLLMQRYVSEFHKKREQKKWIIPEKSTICPGETL